MSGTGIEGFKFLADQISGFKESKRKKKQGQQMAETNQKIAGIVSSSPYGATTGGQVYSTGVGGGTIDPKLYKDFVPKSLNDKLGEFGLMAAEDPKAMGAFNNLTKVLETVNYHQAKGKLAAKAYYNQATAKAGGQLTKKNSFSYNLGNVAKAVNQNLKKFMEENDLGSTFSDTDDVDNIKDYLMKNDPDKYAELLSGVRQTIKDTFSETGAYWKKNDIATEKATGDMLNVFLFQGTKGLEKGKFTIDIPLADAYNNPDLTNTGDFYPDVDKAASGFVENVKSKRKYSDSDAILNYVKKKKKKEKRDQELINSQLF